jgi:type IV pilus assembly protein PilB
VKNVTFYHGAGCTRCRNTGFRGRTALFELMELDNTLRDMTFRREPLTELRKHAHAGGMVTLREDGVRKVLAGTTTIAEVLEVTAKDMDLAASEAVAGV